MKIYCQRSDLNKALNKVSHSIPTRTTSKILEGILVELKDNTLCFTTTDTNMTTETKIGVSAEGEISFVVPYRIFSGIVSKLTDEEVLLDYDQEKRKMMIKSGNSTSEIICFSSDEFPKIKVGDGDKKVKIKKETLKKIIKKTAFAASTDEMNGILLGVLLEIKDRKIRMVATDAFRMALYEAPVDTGEEIETVIPARLINEVTKIIEDDGEEEMTIDFSERKAVFEAENDKIILNTLNGKYIDYNRIIKKEGNIKIRVERAELLRSIDRASILSSIQNNNMVKFNIEGEIIKIDSLSEEGNIEEKVEIIKEGDDLVIGFNSRYMMDILKAIDDEEIKISLKDNISPCIVEPLSGEAYLYLVLPVRIN